MHGFPTVEQARDALARYYEFTSKQLSRTHWSGDPMLCAGSDFIRRERWIRERREYLAKVLSQAIRETTLQNHPDFEGKIPSTQHTRR